MALAEKLAAKGVVVTGVPSGGLLQSILVWGLPALMFYLIWVFLGRRLDDHLCLAAGAVLEAVRPWPKFAPGS